MSSNVIILIRDVREGFPAEPTSMGPLSSVGMHMDAKVEPLSEDLFTQQALEAKRCLEAGDPNHSSLGPLPPEKYI